MELLGSHVFSNWTSSGLGGSILSLELPQFLQWTCRTSHCPYLSRCFHTTYGPCWAFSTWRKVKVKVAQSCLTLCDPMDYTVHGTLQARILEWVAFPFSRGSTQPRGWTQVSDIAGRFFTCWATREAQQYWSGWPIPSPDLPDPEIEPGSPALQMDSLPNWDIREAPILLNWFPQ